MSAGFYYKKKDVLTSCFKSIKMSLLDNYSKTTRPGRVIDEPKMNETHLLAYVVFSSSVLTPLHVDIGKMDNWVQRTWRVCYLRSKKG